jgi:hypothetical protein
MSSPKAAAAKAARRPAAKPKTAKPLAVKSPPPKTKAATTNGVSADAIRLAAEIEREFAKHDDAISPEAMQALMGALCRVYSAQVESGAKHTPIVEGQAVNPTAVMVTASGMLRAANLAVFELGMWQSWTGR